MEELEDVRRALRLTTPSLLSDTVESSVSLRCIGSGFDGSGVVANDRGISVLASAGVVSIIISSGTDRGEGDRGGGGRFLI